MQPVDLYSTQKVIVDFAGAAVNLMLTVHTRSLYLLAPLQQAVPIDASRVKTWQAQHRGNPLQRSNQVWYQCIERVGQF
jgi:hypothetical protein